MSKKVEFEIKIEDDEGNFKSLSEICLELGEEFGFHDIKNIQKEQIEIYRNISNCEFCNFYDNCEYKFKHYKQFDMVSWLSREDLWMKN